MPTARRMIAKPAASAAYLAVHSEARGERASASAAAAFRAARALFDQGESFDMASLARQLGVSRVSLYRWTGDRERLLADLIWANAEDCFALGKRTKTGTVPERLAKGLDVFMRAASKHRGVRRLLRDDNELALRLLTRRRGAAVHERAVAQLTGIIKTLVRKHGYVPRLPPPTLAYALVRVVEGFIYGDLAAGIEPDLRNASRVIRALL